MKIDKNIAEFLGILVGDGFISEAQRTMTLGIICNPSEETYLRDYVAPLFTKIFDTSYNITERDNGLRFRSYSNKFKELEDFGILPGKKNPKIPPQIKDSKTYLKKFMRGIFDTDGCVFWDERERYKRPYPRIQITTAEPDFGEELKHSLKRLGFNPTKRERTKEGYSTETCVEVEVYGFKNLELWKKKIGSNNPVKEEKITEY